MKMHTLKCPHCTAELECEDGLDSFYCKYCGSHLLLEGMSKASYHSKVQVKGMEHQERLRDKEIAQERYKLIYESAEENRAWRRAIFIFAMFILVFGFLIVSPQIEHKETIKRLQELEAQIETDFLNENYEAALFKAQQLRCDDGWSSSERYSWEEKRLSYILMIEEKIHEEEINDPNNIFMPLSSEQYKDRLAAEIETQLTSIGFANIVLQAASEKAGFFNKEGTIEHILVGGKSQFTEEDYFNKDTPIIIYYYSK